MLFLFCLFSFVLFAVLILHPILEWFKEAYDSFNERFVKAKPKASNGKALS